MIDSLTQQAVELLKKLIETASFSKTEDDTATLIFNHFIKHGITPQRYLNNVWVQNKHFDSAKPTLLLNSHHDTVKPNTQYTKNPFEAVTENGKLYGLGSNDAGGALVSLLAVFLYFYENPNLNFNLIYAATAEEEISGANGIESLLPKLGNIDFGIVGEPTQMQAAIAEKGLMVVDFVSRGVAGHAARNEGKNAIYKALKDIDWLSSYKFPKISPTLGEIKISVTLIQAGSQHNVIPDQCWFTADIRTTEMYSNAEILEVIKAKVEAEVLPRSVRLNSSALPENHPVLKVIEKMQLSCYSSPTTSDQALMNFATLKMGPGDSARSHTADEYIYLHEIENGIKTYIEFLNCFNEL